MIKTPERLQTTLYVSMTKYDYESEFSLHVSMYDLRKNQHKDRTTIFICTHELDIPLPQVDATEQAIDSLKQQKTVILAETELAINKIDAEIQSLLAIEYQPEPDTTVSE